MLVTPFGNSEKDYCDLARKLRNHLRNCLTNTNGQGAWSTENFKALTTFNYEEDKVEPFPHEAGHRKGEFLWDYVAYVQGKGILFVAESEWKNLAEKDVQT